jgi:OOP family OmpA-OmpF porin
MNNLSKAAIVATTILALAPVAATADSGFYFGASVGNSTLKDDFNGFDVDTSSNSVRFIAGWQFNKYFSLEGGYQNFGTFEQRFDVGGTPVDVSLKADGFTLGATGFIPLPKDFFLYGRAGAFFWDGDSELNNVSQAKPEDTNPYYGGGVKYALTENISLLGDWTLYELEDTQTEVFALGFTYRF